MWRNWNLVFEVNHSYGGPNLVYRCGLGYFTHICFKLGLQGVCADLDSSFFAGYFGICKGITLGICVLVDEVTGGLLELDVDVSDQHMIPR